MSARRAALAVVGALALAVYLRRATAPVRAAYRLGEAMGRRR